MVLINWMVLGCDGCISVRKTRLTSSERTEAPNTIFLLGVFNVVDSIKAAVD